MTSRFSKHNKSYEPPTVCISPPRPPLPAPLPLALRALQATIVFLNTEITGGPNVAQTCVLVPQPSGIEWRGAIETGPWHLDITLEQQDDDQEFGCLITLDAGGPIIQTEDSPITRARHMDPLDVRFLSWPPSNQYTTVQAIVTG